jgi:hypothetical protein
MQHQARCQESGRLTDDIRRTPDPPDHTMYNAPCITHCGLQSCAPIVIYLVICFLIQTEWLLCSGANLSQAATTVRASKSCPATQRATLETKCQSGMPRSSSKHRRSDFPGGHVDFILPVCLLRFILLPSMRFTIHRFTLNSGLIIRKLDSLIY